MFHIVLSLILWFITLLALQVFVFNHVHIFGYAVPMPYVYFLAILPAITPHWAYVLLGFVMGLMLDLFTNTPGMAAGSLTFVGLITPWVLKLFRPRDTDDEDFEPSHHTMEWGGFMRFLGTLTLVHCILFFVLECFNFFDPYGLLLNMGGSALLTLLFEVAMELIRKK